MLILYNALLVIGAFLWIPWMLFRASARKEKPNWSERAGEYHLPKDRNPKRIWIHAVSVGEVVAVLPIIRKVKELLPDWQILLSVTTSSGHQTAREKGQGLIDHLAYFPIDYPRFVVRAIFRVKPSVVAVMETELWLNFLWTAKQQDAATMLINGRISDRNFKRSRWIIPYYKSLFHWVDQCLMQSERDTERIKKLGAKNAETLGNCKFDQAAEGASAERHVWRQDLGFDPDDLVIVVGSTRGPEDEEIVVKGLELAKRAGKAFKVVHAPRHLERVDALSERVAATWGKPARRSAKESGEYLLLDTYGELSSAYAAADIAIIGGGFAKLGGQNLIQPLAHGVPVIHGPYMHNFRDVTAMADEAGAAISAATPEALAQAVVKLLESREERGRMSAAARRLVSENTGASERYARAIVQAAKATWKPLPAKKTAKT